MKAATVPWSWGGVVTLGTDLLHLHLLLHLLLLHLHLHLHLLLLPACGEAMVAYKAAATVSWPWGGRGHVGDVVTWVKVVTWGDVGTEASGDVGERAAAAAGVLLQLLTCCCSC